MSDFLWQAFVTLLVIIDPFMIVPVFIALTRNDSSIVREKTARKACLIAVILLVFFAIAGDRLLNVMGIAGPGAMTSIVVLMRDAEHISFTAEISVLLIAIFVLALTYMTMRLGERLMKLLGVTGMNVLTRVFGVIVAALATQHIVHGIMTVVRDIR